MIVKSRKKKKQGKKQRKKRTLKKAVRKIAKTILKHLVELPEQERERNIAAFERALAKKFKRPKPKK
jgi:hypothetical protein